MAKIAQKTQPGASAVHRIFLRAASRNVMPCHDPHSPSESPVLAHDADEQIFQRGPFGGEFVDVRARGDQMAQHFGKDVG